MDGQFHPDKRLQFKDISRIRTVIDYCLLLAAYLGEQCWRVAYCVQVRPIIALSVARDLHVPDNHDKETNTQASNSPTSPKVFDGLCSSLETAAEDKNEGA